MKIFIVSDGTRAERKAQLLAKLPIDSDKKILVADFGKPFIVEGPFFNISHSEHFSILAISKEIDVGIDIEVNRSFRYLKEISERFFHPDEKELLSLNNYSLAEFLRIWVMKEAIVKYYGKSLLMYARKVNVFDYSVFYEKIIISGKTIHLGLYRE